MARERTAPRRRVWATVGLGALVLGVGVAVGASLVTVLRPAADPLEAVDHTYVEVVEGEVGSSLNLNTVAQWDPVPAGVSRATGTITQVLVEPGAEVSQGSELFRVDERPVVIAQGEVPTFRDVGEGATGADVRQVQQLLTDLGLYSGEVGGEAGAQTAAAIRAWQRDMGVEQTGVVQAGDVVFVPRLPTRVTLNTEVVARGAQLAGGEQVVSSLAEAPSFVVPVTDAQAAMMPAGTTVRITSPEQDVWEAVVTDQSVDPADGTVRARLAGVDGAVVCGDGCGQVPVTGEALLSSEIVIVPSESGLVVPSAAVVTSADGQTAVIDAAGERLPVTLVASARGMAIIDGVSAGTRVRVPAGAGG